VYKNVIKKGFQYDINSQYPKAQCNELPIGNPIISNNSDLNYYFGFVFVEVFPPIEAPAQYYILLTKNDKGERMNLRTSFKGMYFSEELKQAVSEFGYKVNVIWGYHWPKKSKDPKLFGNFVSTFYDKKSKAIEPVTKTMSKLRQLTNINKIVSDDISIINGLKKMKFYDFNLPYINWFEKIIIFKDLIFVRQVRQRQDRDKIYLFSFYNLILIM
jgi:DNA polymerase type B, organellar and viral